MAAECIKCAQVADPTLMKVYEDPSWVGVSSFGVPGAFQLVARRHVEGLWNLDADEASRLGKAISRVSRSILSAAGAERVYVEAYGEDILHAHVLLLGRTPAIPSDARRGAYFERRSEFVDKAKAQQVAELLRDDLQSDTT